MGKIFTPLYLRISFLLLVMSFGFQTGYAQILSLSPAEIKAQTRKSKKEAARYQAENNLSHLEIQNFTMKKGEVGRKQVPVEEEPAQYASDGEINAIYEEPREADKKAATRKSKKGKNKSVKK